MSYRHMLFFALLLVGLYIVYAFFHMWFLAQKSGPLVEIAHGFEKHDSSLSRTMLVLGDSTAVGVGSPPELTVAGRLSNYLSLNVENHAKSGAVTKDLPGQIAFAKDEKYDLVLIQIGANDVIFFKSIPAAESELRSTIEILKTRSNRIVFLTAGDIGAAPLFPWPIRWIVSSRTRDLRTRFMSVLQNEDVVYADIYSHPDPFASDPQKYYAPDMLHLSGDGYGFWFSVVKEYVDTAWPELLK